MTWLLVMLNKIIAAVAALFAMFGLNILKTKRDEKHGATEAELKNAEEELKAIDEANRIRDRVDNDPEYADRVRSRFERR